MTEISKNNNAQKTMNSKGSRALKAIGKNGCLGILITAFGLAYVVRLLAFNLWVILPIQVIVLGFVSGACLWGISYIASSWFGVVRIKTEKEAIHLSSPLWLDIFRWFGLLILCIVSIVIIAQNQSWWSLFFTFIFISGIVFLVLKIRNDRNDGMIIADEYLSIDVDLSRDKKVFIKKDIKSIKVETYNGTRVNHYYIVISYIDSKEEGLVSEYKFEPIEDLNISRKVIINQLKLKNYSVIEEI